MMVDTTLRKMPRTLTLARVIPGLGVLGNCLVGFSMKLIWHCVLALEECCNYSLSIEYETRSTTPGLSPGLVLRSFPSDGPVLQAWPFRKGLP